MAEPSTTYVVNKSGGEDWVGPSFSCRALQRTSFTVAWSAEATLQGSIIVEGTDDPGPDGDAHWVALTVDKVHGGAGDTPLTLDTDESGVLLVVLEGLPSRMRLRWVETSGGVADQFNVWRSSGAS